MKRKAKKAMNPLYGKKGIGWINNPKKVAYNKVYNKTTFNTVSSSISASNSSSPIFSAISCLAIVSLIVSILFPPLLILSIPFLIYSLRKGKKEQNKKAFYQQFFSELAELENQIQKNQKVKGLKPFFKRIDKHWPEIK